MCGLVNYATKQMKIIGKMFKFGNENIHPNVFTVVKLLINNTFLLDKNDFVMNIFLSFCFYEA